MKTWSKYGDWETRGEAVDATVFPVASTHHWHGDTCLCGAKSGTARRRTEHIIDATLAALASTGALSNEGNESMTALEDARAALASWEQFPEAASITRPLRALVEYAERVEADARTGQAEHARWQERAETAEAERDEFKELFRTTRIKFDRATARIAALETDTEWEYGWVSRFGNGEEYEWLDCNDEADARDQVLKFQAREDRDHRGRVEEHLTYSVRRRRVTKPGPWEEA